MNNEPQGATPVERPVLNALVTLALVDAGNSVSVSIAGEYEYEVENSRDPQEILSNMALGDEDEFLIKDSNNSQLAWFLLIYNNGSDYDPMIVISDYSANDYAEGIWNTLNENFGE
jgi:Flp pilus assembly pilin Flp